MINERPHKPLKVSKIPLSPPDRSRMRWDRGWSVLRALLPALSSKAGKSSPNVPVVYFSSCCWWKSKCWLVFTCWTFLTGESKSKNLRYQLHSRCVDCMNHPVGLNAKLGPFTSFHSFTSLTLHVTWQLLLRTNCSVLGNRAEWCVQFVPSTICDLIMLCSSKSTWRRLNLQNILWSQISNRSKTDFYSYDHCFLPMKDPPQCSYSISSTFL